jgi:osmoprotectant transport system permease protein
MKYIVAFFFALVSTLAVDSAAQAQGKPKVRVGSKSFTESVILGDLLAHLANQSGAEVEHLSELGGTQVLWKALVKGDIDAYVDYTGTIQELLSKLVESGVEVRTELDMRTAMDKLGITMTDRIGFNNTYALGMREDIADKLGITKISDLRDHPELKFGISDTTRSGRRPNQYGSSLSTKRLSPQRMALCKTFSSCANPAVIPVRNRRL